ncbi:hypothetical protein C8R46DRAFT_498636 [Mycena filopes]|nr:hypothetical protein C8R46DRAFT_498636 [Mycena filopes]
MGRSPGWDGRCRGVWAGGIQVGRQGDDAGASKIDVPPAWRKRSVPGRRSGSIHSPRYLSLVNYCGRHYYQMSVVHILGTPPRGTTRRALLHRNTTPHIHYNPPPNAIYITQGRFSASRQRLPSLHKVGGALWPPLFPSPTYRLIHTSTFTLRPGITVLFNTSLHHPPFYLPSILLVLLPPSLVVSYYCYTTISESASISTPFSPSQHYCDIYYTATLLSLFHFLFLCL